MAKKPEILHDGRIIVYDAEHWSLLSKLRKRASDTMNRLEKAGIKSYVYGSLARGDISKTSDIDIIILETLPSYKIEVALSQGILRELVQATPSSVLKGHLHIDSETVVSFPIFKMMSREREFYKWGGMASTENLAQDIRTPGVDKRLVMIDPTEEGHIEYGVVGYESIVAKKLGVSMSIANERVRVLKRRDEVGRTGVYRTYHLQDDETFETAAKKLTDSDPALRRTIKRRN
ncbi:MAG: nucleotidyltransferase domain-containing protein [Candidatus Thorarchaeota archaeon]